MEGGGGVFNGYSKLSVESHITHVNLVRSMRKSIFPSSEKKKKKDSCLEDRKIVIRNNGGRTLRTSNKRARYRWPTKKRIGVAFE